VDDLKAAAAERLHDGEVAVNRLLKQGSYAGDDSIHAITRSIKRHPLGFLSIAFAVGTVVGLLASRSHKQTKHFVS
jgi:ElaB/YqjD/DUF883 family membrane-anchored ribosome-binding protein